MPRRGNKFIAPLTTITLSIQGPEARSSQRAADTSLVQAVPRKIVGRGSELAQLHRSLDRARSGERQIVFVTGEPGIGKTTLVETFLQHPDMSKEIWIGRGQCVEQYGAGEAYLPVLEALGRIGRSPGGEQLVARLNQYAPTWLVQMPALLDATDLETLQRRVAGATRERMLREMVEAIEGLTADRTLVLWLEDLHWADHSTVDWLTAIAQQRGPTRLLVIGTYRPADVSISSHPLKGVKQELQARGQCEEMWLRFLTPEEVAQYLGTRYPHHQFPPNLAQVVHHNTDGNPLFVVNMVDYLTAQHVIAEVEGHWRLCTTVEEAGRGVPESLRQLIEKHVERLSEEQQRLLEVASVVGTAFSAAAVAAGIEAQVEQVEEWCEALVKRGQFLQAQEPSALPDGTICGSYKFLHALYQTVLYERMPTMRRLRLHRRVGDSEERTYGDRAREIASELAVHFERGQDIQRAVKYLQCAAENVLRRYAHREAAEYQQRALTLLQSLPDTRERAQQELVLQIMFGTSLMANKGYGAAEVEQAYRRARELCSQLNDPTQLFRLLCGLRVFYLVRADLQTSHELSDQIFTMAQRAQAPALLLEAHFALGSVVFFRGHFSLAQAHLEKGIAVHDSHPPRLHLSGALIDAKVGCLGYASWSLWFLGYPDQALRKCQEAVARANALSHPLTLAGALHYLTQLHQIRRDVLLTQEQADAAIMFCSKQGFVQLLSIDALLRGWALVDQGHTEEGLAQMRQHWDDFRATGATFVEPFVVAQMVEAYGKNGHVEEATLLLDEGLAVVEQTNVRFHEAELYRLKGELILQQASQKSKVKAQKAKVPNPQSQILEPNSEAEACFLKAFGIARQQQAKSLELRAVMSLVRLRQRQVMDHATRNTQHESRTALIDAHTLLVEIYNWFTEGFDTADLKDARSLLEELASNGVVTSLSGSTPVADKSKKSRAR